MIDLDKIMLELDAKDMAINLELSEIKVSLSTFFMKDANQDKKIEDWLLDKNPALGDVTPMSMVRQGLGHKVVAFIKSRLLETMRESL